MEKRTVAAAQAYMAGWRTDVENARMRSTTEYARFFRADDLGPLDCLDARYRRQVFAPHFHEAFVVNTLLAGAQRYRYRGSGPGGPFARYRRAPRIGAGIEPVGVTADHAGDGRG